MINENWALLCEIGFWGWILSVAVLLIHTFSHRNDIDKLPAVFWGLVSVVFYVFWIYGMVSA